MVDARERKQQDFTDLLRPYRDRLHTLARGMIGPLLRPHVDAADLVQELELILWLGYSSGAYEVRTPGQLLALARAILHGCVSRQWRASNG